MKPCKEKLPDGIPCPNQVDEGQEYCPYHLAKQVAEEKKIFFSSVAVAGALSIFKIDPKVAAKGVASFLSKK
jgi:hypothetical protein